MNEGRIERNHLPSITVSSGSFAKAFVMTAVTLTESEHLSAIETASTGIVGGAIYDALIARCAAKANADILLTWNLRDFNRLNAEIRQIVRSPSEFKPTE